LPFGKKLCTSATSQVTIGGKRHGYKGKRQMTEHGFDKDYWQEHWEQTQHNTDRSTPNPYLAGETSGLAPGTALDSGCGAGAEAAWLASHGWEVTAADISAEALARAAARETSGRVRWVEADLTAWDPGTRFDLVMTHYAHPAMPQLAFYERISAWVAPGGTLLIVGHQHTSHAAGHGDHPPAHASVTLDDITATLDSAQWKVTTAEAHVRAITGREVPLYDVVVRATRLP
jgi:SAM-dependent methyltransferase